MKNVGIIGRDDENLLLADVIANYKANLVAVYGRRRIGKTYLLKTYQKKQIVFQFSGVHNVRTPYPSQF